MTSYGYGLEEKALFVSHKGQVFILDRKVPIVKLLTIALKTDADLFKGLLTPLFLGAYQNRCGFDQRL